MCFVGSISVSSIKCHLAWDKFESKPAGVKNKNQNDKWEKQTGKWENLSCRIQKREYDI